MKLINEEIYLNLQVGDCIRDIEDGDCFFEGIVTNVDEQKKILKYRLTRVVWNGEEDWDCTDLLKEIDFKWYYIEKIEYGDILRKDLIIK